MYLRVSLPYSCEHLSGIDFVWALVLTEESHLCCSDQSGAAFRRFPPINCLHRVPSGDVASSASDQLCLVHFDEIRNLNSKMETKKFELQWKMTVVVEVPAAVVRLCMV